MLPFGGIGEVLLPPGKKNIMLNGEKKKSDSGFITNFNIGQIA